jgi:hypothetical protein
VADGRNVLEQADHLLQPHGMTLKGKDGVYDLSTGCTAQPLGFDISWPSAGLHLRPCSQAYDNLRSLLKDTWKTHTPTISAKQALTSWVRAYAPGLQEDNLPGLLSVAAEYGFREIPLSTLSYHHGRALCEWQRRCWPPKHRPGMISPAGARHFSSSSRGFAWSKRVAECSTRWPALAGSMRRSPKETP